MADLGHAGRTRPAVTTLLPELIAVPAGEYVMGGSPGDKFVNATELPRHPVKVAAFFLAVYPVTESQWREFRGIGSRTDLPVVNVSWDDARSYCEWVGGKLGIAARLCSEAEWEYACRAGAPTPFACGQDITIADANFFFDESGRRVGRGGRVVVGEYSANAFGVCDMHGNVCEWVGDVWHPDHRDAPQDGSVREGQGDRVIRGGAWDYLPRLLRASWRDHAPAATRRDNLGFRIAAG